MAASTPRYGIDARVYLNTGSYGTPTWTHFTPARDVTLDGTRTEGDVSSRGSGIKKTAGVMRDFSVDIEAIWDDTNTQFQSLLDSFNGSAGSTVEMLIIDGVVSTTGNEGLRAHMSVLKFARAEPLEGTQMATIGVKPGPCSSSEEPTWYTSA